MPRPAKGPEGSKEWFSPMEDRESPVRAHMTPCPLTMHSTDSIALAAETMREKRIRHIPILDEKGLAGMISDRDVGLVLSLLDVDPRRVTVGTVMSCTPFVVSPDTPLRQVVSRMAEEKLDAAVIVEDGRTVGIFTTVDALAAFSRSL